MVHILANIVILVVILFAMCVILLGLRHIGNDDMSDNRESAGRLRRDVKDKESVISNDSVFHNFLVSRSDRRHAHHPSPK